MCLQLQLTTSSWIILSLSVGIQLRPQQLLCKLHKKTNVLSRILLALFAMSYMLSYTYFFFLLLWGFFFVHFFLSFPTSLTQHLIFTWNLSLPFPIHFFLYSPICSCNVHFVCSHNILCLSFYFLSQWKCLYIFNEHISWLGWHRTLISW